MIDFEKARKTMVDCQIRPNDVTDYDVLEAFLTVPREHFVPAAQKALAYIDDDLPLTTEGEERFLMEAMDMAKMVQLAAVEEDNIVLDIGCGSGYSSAILSTLCNSVVAVESDPALADQAGQTLLDHGYDNVVVTTGTLEKGNAKEGPYDVIFIGGAVDEVPPVLTEQLKDGGRLVAVDGTGNSAVARLYTREGDVISSRVGFNCATRSLPGFQKVPEFSF